MIVFPPGAHLHLVGIGGVGMSAIARVLIEQGYRVSGSDRTTNAYTHALAERGAVIYSGHAARHITDAPPFGVIISSAVKDNPEVEAAQRLRIPVYKRSDVIAGLMHGQTVIAVAGAHGKTTTTAMIVHILREVGREPGYIIGGSLRQIAPEGGSTNASAGRGEVFVVEADEYDYMFLGLRPNIAVVTNVEWDHPDCFPTREVFHEAFEQFAALLPDDGVLIGCADDRGARALLAVHRERHDGETEDYGISHEEAAWTASGITYSEQAVAFDVGWYFQPQGRAALRIPGRVNVLNALAAIAAAARLGVSPTDAMWSLETFAGVGRRFEIIGEIGAGPRAITVVDDYAHNPTKILATLQAARARYPGRQIWAIWQPHTYSRTHTFLAQYTQAFVNADHVLVTDIFGARETPLPGVDGASTAAAIAASHPDARHVPTFEGIVEILRREVQPPAAVLILSAGHANLIGFDYLRAMSAYR
jgi:UDP-N-acetylmuramate--alanine ligase